MNEKMFLSHLLGLAIAKDAINSHGGEILLDESVKLKGLKVIIILPV